MHVGLATGRIPGPWSDALCAELPGLGASVFANGCLVAEPRQLGGAVLLEHALPPAAVAAAMPYADVEGESADFCGWLEPIRSITYEASDDERPFACGCVA